MNFDFFLSNNDLEMFVDNAPQLMGNFLDSGFLNFNIMLLESLLSWWGPNWVSVNIFLLQ